jgi:alpha-glucosidase (family GH31 glycosyl hydrolase)
MRPLALHYPADPNVWEMGFEYLLGADLLVAPVTRAGGDSWPVYLPAGDWFDFWTGERHVGGRAISAPTPLGTIPVFARGGSIIPLGPVMQRTGERQLDDLTLVVYPGEPGALTLYEDDGESQGYRAGQRALTEIRSSFDDGVVRVDVSATTGEYVGQPASRDLTVRVWSANPPRSVQVTGDGQVVQLRTALAEPSDTLSAYWRYEEPSWAVVRLPRVGRAESVTIEISR